VVGSNQGPPAGHASSAVELPHGACLYLDKDSAKPHLLRAGEAPPGLELNQYQVPQNLALRQRSDTDSPKGKWIVDPDMPTSLFKGELRLMPAITSQLVADAISCDLPNEVFVEYVDSTLGRPPVRLGSSDGRTYALTFNESARHPVFLLQGGWSDVASFYPSSRSTIELGAGAEFILGATHYRLRQVAASGNDVSTAGPRPSHQTGDSL
jgi:hypothetical protein